MARKETQKSKYRLKNRHKYKGDPNNIVARSSWERQLLRWCDENPNVVQFSSEEIVIPYQWKSDNSWHRYFVDFYIKTQDGTQYLIEVKPAKFVMKPPMPKRQSRKHLEECLNWQKNKWKWDAAMAWAQKNNMIFEVWTEHKLQELGLKILKG